jgi:hypothetical protein
MSFLFLICAQYKRFIRAVNYTGGYLPPGTKVALNNSFAIQVSAKRPVRAGYYARPTASTLFHINGNLVTCRVFLHRTCKAGINTPGLGTVAALNGKGNLYIPLHTHTRQRTGSLSFKCFDWVLRLRVLHSAINFTQSTANADFFLNIYSSHALKSSRLLRTSATVYLS